MNSIRSSVFLFLLLSPVFIFAQSSLININTADSEALQTLNGIGEVKAAAIIEYRNGPNGPFETIEEINEVTGIGDATYNNIKDFITVGNTSSTTPTTPASTTTESTSTTTTTTSSNSSSSSHSSPTPLSNWNESEKFKISAGRSRLATVGFPLNFIAESNTEQGSKASFRWNFGDGATGEGQRISHSYAYPGEYVVVLNANLRGQEAVGRTSVSVTAPNLAVTYSGPERVEVKNDSPREVNLYGRAIIAGGKKFEFPDDTIIGAGQSVSFPASVTGLPPVSAAVIALQTERAEEPPQENIEPIPDEALSIYQEAERLYAEVSRREQDERARRVTAEPQLVEPEEILGPETETATVLGATEEAPLSWIDIVRKFFLRTQ